MLSYDETDTFLRGCSCDKHVSDPDTSWILPRTVGHLLALQIFQNGILISLAIIMYHKLVLLLLIESTYHDIEGWEKWQKPCGITSTSLVPIPTLRPKLTYNIKNTYQTDVSIYSFIKYTTHIYLLACPLIC